MPKMKKGIEDRSSIPTTPLPGVNECFCHRCGRRVGYPHFSAEEFPKVFCTWFCSFKYHQIHGCGVYRIEKNKVEIVEDTTRGLVILIEPSGRPTNHPVRD